MSDENTSKYLESKTVRDAQVDLFRAIDEYKAILKDSVHPDNQNDNYKKREQIAIDKVIKGASDLDFTLDSPGAGIFGVISLLFRSVLYLKNEIIKVRKEFKKNEIEIMKMQANLRATKKKTKST
jgi:hypothetical protein